jgi:hypothetical protein
VVRKRRKAWCEGSGLHDRKFERDPAGYSFRGRWREGIVSGPDGAARSSEVNM